jgi:DNA-binding MarR family transcriptional regulator
MRQANAWGIVMTDQRDALATALLLFGPLYDSWVEQSAPDHCQGAKVRLLTMLHHTPHMPMGHYARVLGISKAHMTTLVEDFVHCDIVTRVPDEHDRRSSHLVLTPHGSTLATAVWAQWVTQSATAFADISAADQAVFVAVCQKVASRLNGAMCPMREKNG